MDERRRELNELQGYGNRLLEEMKYPDLMGMLRETISHLHRMAEEYAEEANDWNAKYETCAKENEKLQRQITELKNAVEKQNEEFQKRAEKIGKDFRQELEELRSHRDAEVNDYAGKIQSLVAAQGNLEQMQKGLAGAKKKLDAELKKYEKATEEQKNARQKYEDQLDANQAKIDAYQDLFDFKLNAEAEKEKLQKKYEEKLQYAEQAYEELATTCNEIKTRNDTLEKENAQLKQPLQNNVRDDASGEEANESSQTEQETQPSCSGTNWGAE